MDNFILIGMPGAGKSTVGVLLAKRLGYGFLDIDLILQQRGGMLLQPLLEQVGLQRFLDMEAEAICAVDCRRTVIAPGGSCVLRERGMHHLAAQGAVLYLDVPLPTLARRLGNAASRGIAMPPGRTLEAEYALRAPLYRAWARAVIPVAPGQRIATTVDAAAQICEGLLR